jgi:hypothetical protein
MIFGSQATGVNIMGKLVEGIWLDEWYDTDSTGGKFVRENADFVTGSKRADALLLSPAVITCMYPWPARGLTAL